MKETDKYISLYEEVRKDIIDGTYKRNSKLPSKRVMADSKNVSVITVSHAYELLCEEGYVISKEKSGYFVAYDPKNAFESPATQKLTKAFKKKTFEYEKDSEAFSFSTYAKTVRHVLSEYAEEVMLRSPGAGTDILREAIADYLKRSRHFKVDKSQIFIGSGAEYLYELIVEFFGREIIYGIESPSYAKIEGVYRAGGANIEMLPLSGDGIESKALWDSDASVLHISPYRSFPSKITASAGKKREYLNWSIKKNSVIIEDDYESEFSLLRKPEESLFSLDKSDRVIYLNTFTQTVGSFIRTAYMVVPKSLLSEFSKKVSFHSCPVPTPEQYTLAELINNGDFERHINKVRRNARKNQH